MLADRTFQQILEEINNSKLNYQLQLSPFVAWISIKKSFIKDKAGAPIFSISLNNTGNNNENLKNDFQMLLKDYEHALETIRNLQNHAENNLKTEEDEKCVLLKKCNYLETLLHERDQAILTLNAVVDSAREAAITLNRQINENNNKFKEKKANLLKEHRLEVKILKKELGPTNSETSYG